jgi:hypothetical protein
MAKQIASPVATVVEVPAPPLASGRGVMITAMSPVRLVQQSDHLATCLAFAGALIVAVIAAVTAQWRLRTQLAAEHDRIRWQAVREVLDRGAVLLTEFEAMTNALRQVAPDKLELPPGWDTTVDEVGVFRVRLRLWFADEDNLVKAFDEVVSTAVWTSELREGLDSATWLPEGVSPDAFEAIRPRLADYVREDVEANRKRFLDAARHHLKAGAG